jgi:hypothetical protein
MKLGAGVALAALLAGLCLTLPAAAPAGGRALSKPSKGGRAGYPWKKRVASARRFARRRAGTVSFAVIGEHGNMRGLRARREFHSASVVKALLMTAYLRRPSVRHRSLNAGDKALLGPMITRSDNATASVVYGIVGGEGLRRLARRARLRDFHPNLVWGLTRISAGDMASFMYRLRRYLPRRHRHYAFELLAHIVSGQRWGIPPARPRGWRVYFKGGWTPAFGGWRINQIARLVRGDRKLGLAVLTQGNPSHAYGTESIRGVTKRLLRHYNRLTRGPRRGTQALPR